MASSLTPDDDPAKLTSSTSDDSSKPDQGSSPSLKSTSPFKYTEDDGLDDIRKTMAKMDEEEEKGGDSDNKVPAFENEPVNGAEPGDANQSPALFEEDLQNQEQDDDLTSRINSLQDEPAQDITGPFYNMPPFLLDEGSGGTEEDLTLAEKLRKGLVPSEKIRELITESMTDDEVIEVCNTLGIDWNLTTGETRAEKIEFLVDYFRRDAQGEYQQPFLETTAPKTPSFYQEHDWRESDSRLQSLQENLNIPETPIKKEKRVSFLSRFVEDFNQSTPTVRWLTIGLSIFAIILTAAVIYLFFTFRNTALFPSQTTPIEHPFPTQIQLPGGWVIDLAVGTVKDGSWNPTGPEWLQGTEVCRLISLPWTKQLDAVVQTASKGDIIQLTMSNKDLLGYKVESMQTLNQEKLNQLITGDSPCLLVQITKVGLDERQVIIAAPFYPSTGVIVTITPEPIQTKQP